MRAMVLFVITRFTTLLYASHCPQIIVQFLRRLLHPRGVEQLLIHRNTRLWVF